MKITQIKSTLFIFLIALSPYAQSKELLTNVAYFNNVPKWVTRSRVNRIADRVTRYMEWSIRRMDVEWYDNQQDFQNAHQMGPYPVAVTQKKLNKILLGPKVHEKNFDQIFGHELVHVTSVQKYKDAIPPWLEEGVANFISKGKTIDYAKLAKSPIPEDVKSMSHPIQGTYEEVLNKYMMSQALTEMIASKCDFINLLRLSVQRKLEDYLENICRIKELNQSFREWIYKKSKK